jgi:pimeloyl-ACP methyl ester carboxylesterase
MTTPDLTTFSIHGHTLAALTLNPGQTGIPVILVHGVADSLYFWSRGPAAPFLAFGPCTSLALPGHYPAVFPNELSAADLTADLLADLITAAIRRTAGGQPALLVGHSTGAFAILAAAAAYPELARGVISISGFARGQWSGFLAAYQWMASHEPLGSMAFSSLFSLGRNKTLFNLTAQFHTPGQDKAAMKTSYEAFLALSSDSMQLYFAAMHELDILPRLDHILSPTLVMAGSRDPTVPPAQSRQIAAAIRGAESTFLPGGGHHIFFDNPNWYQQTITHWLARTF